MSIEIRKPLAFKGDEKERGLARKAIAEFFRTAAKDRVLLLSIAAGGLRQWMKTSATAFKGFRVDDLQREAMFRTLQEHAGDNPKAQLDALLRAELVAIKLEKLEGLARFITDDRHLDQVLETHLPDNAEREAIRQQMLVIMKKGVVLN